MESEVLVLCTKLIHFLSGQIVKYPVSSSTLAVNDISGRIANGVLEVAGVFRHVVVYTVDCSLGRATTFGNSVVELIETVLGRVTEIADTLCKIVSNLIYSSVDATESLTEGLLDVCKAC